VPVMLSASEVFLDLDALRTFVAIIDLGSFSKAASAVGRSPAAVSMHVKKLETRLGVQLLDRRSRKMVLTRHGEKLLSYARRLVDLSTQAAAEIITPDLDGAVRLGVPNDLAETILPAWLKCLRDLYPAIAVDVSLGTSESILKRIGDGSLNLAIVNFASNRAEPPGELLRVVPTVWVGATQGKAHLRNPLPLALYSQGCIWREGALEQLNTAGRSHRIAFESNQGMGQKAAVEEDIAVAPLPLSSVSDRMDILGAAEGFNALPSFEIRLVRGKDVTVASGVVASFIEHDVKI